MSHARRRTSFVVSLMAVTLTAAALLLGGAFSAQAKHKAKVPAAPAADCKTDEDCVAVPDDCCACSEGGKQHAIPKKQQSAYEKARHKRCAGTMCTEVMSQDMTCSQHPFCGAGICELVD